jgi:hypothetical protein
MDAGCVDDAARVMILRGDSEPNPKVRLQHYVQAVATAHVGAATHRRARIKRSLLTIVLAGDAAVSAVARRDLMEAARELEAAGEPERAAEAYALARDAEGEARALAMAGDVDKLETLLSLEHEREGGKRRRREAHAEIEMLVATGKRRDALAVAEATARAQPDDHEAGEKEHALRSRRAMGPVVRVMLRGKPLVLVLGDSVVIGRTEGALTVASQAISRRHLAIARENGRARVRDLASRNGTQLHSMNIAGSMDVGDGLELKLGREVPVRVAPSGDILGALTLELAGERYFLPLGPAPLGIGAWRMELGLDGWVELATDDNPPAFMGPLTLAPRTTLLGGDAVASTRGGEAVLRIVG